MAKKDAKQSEASLSILNIAFKVFTKKYKNYGFYGRLSDLMQLYALEIMK